MSETNLDFLQFLTSDGNLSLEHIDKMLPLTEEPTEKEVLENPENQNLLFTATPTKSPESPESPGSPETPVIDGLEFVNRKNNNLPTNAEDLNSSPEGLELYPEPDPELGLETEEGEINHFAIFGKGLAELGKLSLEEGEDPEKVEWNQDTFIERLDKTLDTGAWNKLGELATEAYGEEGVRLVEDLFVNKVPLREYLSSYQQEKSIEDLDISNERNQVEIVRHYLSTVVGEDSDEIEQQLDYMKSSETLEKKAANYQQKLIANESKIRDKMATEAQARKKQFEDYEAARVQIYSQIVNDAVKTGELNGIPFKKEDVNKVLNAALNREFVLANGQKITPFEYKLATLRKDEPAKYLQIVKLVEDGLNLNPVMQKGVTEKTNEIFKGLQTKTKTSNNIKKNTNVFNKYIKQL